jgi:hypothetical protein
MKRLLWIWRYGDIYMEIFCNEEELNDSNIDAFTNHWLAFIAGYCVVKIE